MIQRNALYTPQSTDEIIDFLGMMMLSSPTFIDNSGFFASRNVDSVFLALNEALRSVQGELKEPLYLELREMSDRMRAHFEADPKDETGDTRKGQALINKMTDLLIQSIRASQQPAAS
jgi:hypothetical protein